MQRSGRDRIARRSLVRWPVVLLIAGIMFVVTSLSYAQEGRSDEANRATPAGSDDAASEHVLRNTNRESQHPTFSPLHSFLRIDPATGEFLPEPQRNDQASGSADAAHQHQPADQQPHSGRRLPQSPEEANAAIQDFLRQLDGGSAEGLDHLLSGSLDLDRLAEWREKILIVVAAILLIYPLGIVLSEWLAYFARRKEIDLSELDQRYYRTRLRRRLTLSALLMALIGVFAVGNFNDFWWRQPVWFTLFCSAAIVITVWAAALAALIKQAAQGYSVAIIRDIRRHQLELRLDLDELSRRLGHVRLKQP